MVPVTAIPNFLTPTQCKKLCLLDTKTVCTVTKYPYFDDIVSAGHYWFYSVVLDRLARLPFF